MMAGPGLKERMTTSTFDRNAIQQEVLESLDRRFSTRGILRMRLQRRLHRALFWLEMRVLFTLKRVVDLGASLFLIALTLPVFVPARIFSWMGRYPMLDRARRAGRWLRVFDRLTFTCPDTLWGGFLRRSGLRILPVFLNILGGDMSFIGPRCCAPEELDPADREVRRRSSVRPGLICSWWIRNRSNIAYDTEFSVDREYVDHAGLKTDIGIALRAIPAVLYGQGVDVAPDRIRMLGIPINNLTMDEALDEVMRSLEGTEGRQVCFVNADCANIAYRNADYWRRLNSAAVVLADGIGMKLAGRMLKKNVRENVNGTDMLPRLLDRLKRAGHRLYLLGAKPGVAEDVRQYIEENHPGVTVCGTRHGYFNDEEEAEVVNGIREARADLLLVAFGAPQQDLWIGQHLEALGVKVAMGVGGLFDFYSGRIPRAPLWMREAGFEWLYRFICEPRRMWRRYFVGNFVFLWRVMLEKLGAKMDHFERRRRPR